MTCAWCEDTGVNRRVLVTRCIARVTKEDTVTCQSTCKGSSPSRSTCEVSKWWCRRDLVWRLMLECRKLALYLATDALPRNSNLATWRKGDQMALIVVSYGAGNGLWFTFWMTPTSGKCCSNSTWTQDDTISHDSILLRKSLSLLNYTAQKHQHRKVPRTDWTSWKQDTKHALWQMKGFENLSQVVMPQERKLCITLSRV